METTIQNTMQNKLFDFDKVKVQGITLEQLERTQLEKDVMGKPLRGIYHFELLRQILSMCKMMGYDTEVYDLFAAQNKERMQPGVVIIPEAEEKYGERAVEAHLLRRVFANIRIKDFDDEETTTNLSIAFHQKGIQVGFGANVIICHNQCMLCADRYISTYNEKGNPRRGAEEKVDVSKVLETVKGWLIDAKMHIESDRKKIAMMKNIPVNADQMFRLIGLLTALRVKCDTLHKEIRSKEFYPLNQAQISLFTEKMILHYHKEQHITLWDVYNAATDLYKAQSMDIPSMLPQNRAMVSFLTEQFGL